jgi:hypothetical protein
MGVDYRRIEAAVVFLADRCIWTYYENTSKNKFKIVKKI